MPRSNLTLKQKCQIIELVGEMTTERIAKKFHVHPTTITRTLKKKDKILEQASRVNINFKTVQTLQRSEEHDAMVLEFIRSKQDAKEEISIQNICDKAIEYAATLNRTIKSRRGWWRRFKVRCNIARHRIKKRILPNPAIQRGLVKKSREKRVDDRKQKGKMNEKGYSFKVRTSAKKIIEAEDEQGKDCPEPKTTDLEANDVAANQPTESINLNETVS